MSKQFLLTAGDIRPIITGITPVIISCKVMTRTVKDERLLFVTSSAFMIELQ